MTRKLKFRVWNGRYMVASSYGDWISMDGVPYTEADKKYDTPNVEIQKAKNNIIMQSTGLKDKKGKEIYEGDIIKFSLEDGTIEFGVVRFSKAGFWTSQEDGFSEELLSDELNSSLVYELVGDIYCTPELLQK